MRCMPCLPNATRNLERLHAAERTVDELVLVMDVNIDGDCNGDLAGDR